MKILIVEDDQSISNLLFEILHTKYEIIRAYNGLEAVYMIDDKKPDLVLLDLMLPSMTGESVLEYIKGKARVIILSAKSSKYDRISGLLNGANDYITKPFDKEELLARIDVQLRELYSTSEIVIKEIKLDNNNMTVFVNSEELKLTRSEFRILALLMSNPNKVFSRSQIFSSISGMDAIGDEESIKVHVSNIRSKIKKLSDVNYIETVWGIGFRFIE